MAQHDYIIENAPGGPVRTDINAVLQAIASNNSGSVEPTVKYPGQFWLDTAVNAAWPNGRLKVRNAANSGWVDPPANPSLASGQLAFPATANPSTDPYTLDDYREGSFSPTVSFGGAAVGITYSLQQGLYVKAGQLVLAKGRVTLSAKGTSTGAARIGGLPFTSAAAYGAVTIGWYAAMSGLAAAMAGYMDPSNSSFALMVHGAANTTGITDANFSATSSIIFTAAYRAAS